MEGQGDRRRLEIDEMVGEAPFGHRVANKRRVEVVALITVFVGEAGHLHPLPLLDRQPHRTGFFIEFAEVVLLHLGELVDALVDQTLLLAAVVQVKDRAGREISVVPTKRFFPAFAESTCEVAVGRCIELAFTAMRANRWGHRFVIRVMPWPKGWQPRQRAGGRREMPGAMPRCRQPTG